MDAFANYAPGLESPITHVEPVTPNDNADLARITRALNVTQSGPVRITAEDGSVATIFVAAGIAFPIRASRVWATETNAGAIVAMS